MIPLQFRIKNTVKYPTSLIFGGLSRLGLEIADSLLEQGGYVIIVDTYSEQNIGKLQVFPKDSLISFIDYTTLPNLDEELRRLDYIFFFDHESADLNSKVSPQDLLKISNYLDTTLALCNKFEAKFLLTTSIKAHQINLHNEDFKALNHEEHKSYTQADIQRHAESMVMEYIEKNSLDARIVRLGELIGDGIDFAINTPFTQLVLDAAKGTSLKLYKDGLETEWLVHLLDAAYGIIKAQFTKSTTGKTYSISYDNNFSHLAIAYKLQEVEPAAEEIEFVEGKDNLPTLKIYKPAPNLSTIGWTSKVSFEKALKQSVAAAKIYLLENNSPKEKKDNISGKLKTFFALAGSADSSTKDLDKEYDGPISRLIAERKKQEELKQQSIELASSSIKIKKKKKPRTFKEKFNNWAWENFLSIGNTFTVFKNKSPAEFFGIVFIAILILVVFFGIVSPGLVFTRNLLLILPEYNPSVESIKSSSLFTNSIDFKAIKSKLDENIKILDGFTPFFGVIALGEENNEVSKVLKNYSEVIDGLNDISFALNPIKEYLNNYQGNLQQRTSTESYLSVINSGIDYENYLLDFHDTYPYLQTGVQKYQKAISDLRKTDLSLIPTLIQENINTSNNTLFELEDDISALQRLEYFEDMLGVYSPKTYLILLLDNTRLKGIGGEISAYALITVKNGSVIEVTVKSPEETQFNMSSITDRKLKDINANKFTYKTKENIAINDLTNLTNYETFTEYISDIFKDTFSREIAGVSALNYPLLQDLLSTLSYESGININSTDFTKGDLLQNLTSVQDLNAGIDYKHKVTAQLLASVIYSIFTNPKDNWQVLTKELSKSIDSKDLLVSTPNIQFNKIVQENSYNAESITNQDSYVRIGFNIDDNKIISLDKYPELNIVKEVAINPEFKLENKITVEFPVLGSSQEIAVCIPFRVSNSAIKVNNFPIERIAINESQNEKCIVAKAITERQFQVVWSIDTASTESQKDLSLAVAKVKGTESSLDYKITIDGTLTLVDSNPFIAPQGNSLIFTTYLDKDQTVILTIAK